MTKRRDDHPNLIDVRTKTPEERRAQTSKAGKASGRARRAKRTLRQLAGMMLESSAPDKLAAQVTALAPDIDAGEVTTGAVMLAGQVNAAAKGNAQAARYVSELAGVFDEDAGEEEAARPWAADLSLLIGRDFVDLHRRIHAGEVTDAWLPGGRGSLKSSYASLEIASALMADPDANALVVQSRRVNIRDASMAQMLWAFDVLGVAGLWRPTGSTLRINNVETGQAVVFRGVDEPKKLKSIKLRRGHWRYLWVEEADLLRGMDEVRSIRQTVSRSPAPVRRIYTFNPPRTRDSWANREVARVREDPAPGEAVADSCYTDAPPEWLGEQFVADAEALKEADPEAYRHEYLGEPVGVGGEVFDRVEFRAVTDAEIAAFDRPMAGQDFGWWPDPWAMTVSEWDPGTRTLTTWREDGGNKLQPPESAERARHLLTWPDGPGGKPVEHRIRVMSDDAAPEQIAAQRDAGLDARAAGKGNMRTASYRWLAGVRWVIDPQRCPRLAEEVRHKLHCRSPQGEWLEEVEDGDDHYIDATRYAVMGIVRRARTAYRGATGGPR